MFSVSTENELVIGSMLWVFSINIHTTIYQVKHPQRLVYMGRFSHANKSFLSFKVDEKSKDEIKVNYDDTGYPMLITKSHIVAKTKREIFDKISQKNGISKKVVFLKKYREHCMLEQPEWFI